MSDSAAHAEKFLAHSATAIGGGALRARMRPVSPGTVYLVGAGPGDPGLLTVRALDLVRQADVVLHDHLVSAEILAECAPLARVISVGKVGHGPQTDQTAIERQLIAFARDGCRVVRLKGGDPLLFGRGSEEAAALRAAQRAVRDCARRVVGAWRRRRTQGFR